MADYGVPPNPPYVEQLAHMDSGIPGTK